MLMKAVTYITVLLLIGFSLMPFVWILSTALKPQAEIWSTPPHIIPHKPTLEHFQTVTSSRLMMHYLANSAIVACSATVLGVIVGLSGGYGFARFQFKGKRALFLSVLGSRILPRAVLLIPLYLVLVSMRLMNSYLGLIIVYLVLSLPLSTWLFAGFFKGVPKELEEAALIDGCSRVRALFRVILPVSAPAIGAIAMYCFILAWNEFLIPLVLTTGTAVKPMSIGLTFYVEPTRILWGEFTAASMLITVPVVVIFIVFQRFFISGLLTGSVKG